MRRDTWRIEAQRAIAEVFREVRDQGKKAAYKAAWAAFPVSETEAFPRHVWAAEIRRQWSEWEFRKEAERTNLKLPLE